MIHIYFLGTEAFVILGYLIGSAIFPKRYSLIFYKFFGITLFALSVWYASIITGKEWTSLILPVTICLTALGLIISFIFRKRLNLPTKSELLAFLGVEIISYIIYLIFVYVRTYKTDILGTEKLMDVALINTILKQGHLPIENPWLEGFYMNYYYFGHFVLALLQYLFKVPTAIGYNLAISLIGVWIVQAGYVFGKSLRLGNIQSLLTSIIMTFGGNLYLLFQIIAHNNSNQWFASATRVIPYTINEFPAYSVVLGDLHGHYLSYPFFLIGAFLLVDIFFPQKDKVERGQKELVIAKSLFLGVLLGHLYLTNSWDVLTLGLLGGVIVAAVVWYRMSILKQVWKELFSWLAQVGLTILLPIAVLSLPQFLASRQYYLPPVGGIGINTVFSPLGAMFLLFGQFMIIVLCSFLIAAAIQQVSKKNYIELFLKDHEVMLPILFILLAGLLVLMVEFVYAKDVFSTLNPPYARTNTVFKIYYHAWSFFAFGSIGLFLGVLKQSFLAIRKAKWVFIVYSLFVMTVAVMLSYTFISVDQYLAPQGPKIQWQRVNDPKWSDGYTYIKTEHGVDYDLINHLMSKPFSRILEIVTYDSYSYYARISAYTGMSAVTGWPLHNVQWYDGYDGKGILVGTKTLAAIEIANRVTDVETMYTSQDSTVVSELLKKYDVDYVVFGDQEQIWARDKSKELNVDLYKKLCKIDWQNGDTYLFKCR